MTAAIKAHLENHQLVAAQRRADALAQDQARDAASFIPPPLTTQPDLSWASRLRDRHSLQYMCMKPGPIKDAIKRTRLAAAEPDTQSRVQEAENKLLPEPEADTGSTRRGGKKRQGGMSDPVRPMTSAERVARNQSISAWLASERRLNERVKGAKK